MGIPSRDRVWDEGTSWREKAIATDFSKLDAIPQGIQKYGEPTLEPTSSSAAVEEWRLLAASTNWVITGVC